MKGAQMKACSRRPSIARAMLAWLVASCLVAGPDFGAAITFSTALPVTQGQGILRLQIKSLRSGGDSTALDRDLDVQAFPLVGVYGATPKLALFAIVPTLDKQLDVNTPAGRRRRAATGLGDVTLLARYTVYQRDRRGQTLRIAPFAGIEAPTGKDDEHDALGPLPRPLQLGSGSWDYLVGTIVTRQTLAWQVDASASYRVNTVANGFELGDIARLDLSYQRRLSPRELGSGVPPYGAINRPSTHAASRW